MAHGARVVNVRNRVRVAGMEVDIMSTPRLNYSPRMTNRLVETGVFETEHFFLVDVGASGGIESHWRIFGEYLNAVGFDPLVKECARLNQAERSPNVRYHAAYVGAGESASFLPSEENADPDSGWSNQPFPRTSATRAEQALSISAMQRYNSGDEEILLSDERVSLDEYFSGTRVNTIDFIKIDTDGHDYEVLCGARDILAKHLVLGLYVECQFHGQIHPRANLFSNIDRLLREEGFSLFDIEVYRYTRACLPGKFVYDIPAQTTGGQVLWGDALYLRDAAVPGYEDRWECELSVEKLIKLACLFEIYGLPDCEAELLLAHKGRLGDVIDVPGCLDLLAAEADPSSPSFEDHNRKFDEEPESFFPGEQEPWKEKLRTAEIGSGLFRLKKILGSLRTGPK